MTKMFDLSEYINKHPPINYGTSELDRVMTAFEYCLMPERACQRCPGYIDRSKPCYIWGKALFYLNEYSTSLHNEPLKWSELKEMDEQPIWVEVYHGERAWFLVFVDPDDDEKIYGIDAYGTKRQFNKNLWTNGTVKGYRNGRYKTD